MSIKASVGISSGEDPYLVGVNACHEAISGLGEGKKADLVLVFSSAKLDQEKMLSGVRSVSDGAMLIGSSTAGEITTAGPARRNSVAVMAISSPEIKFSASSHDISADATLAGKKVAEEIKSKAGNDLKVLTMFSDVLSGNGADTVSAIFETLGQNFLIAGGSSGDDFEFKKTYQYLNDKVYSNSVVALGMSGNFKVGVGVKHGWTSIGLSKKVTKSKGSTVYEIDGKPAIDIYKGYFTDEELSDFDLGSFAKIAITYPIGMKIGEGGEFLIRSPISSNKDGSITFAASVPEGNDVRLMIGNIDVAIASGKSAAEDAVRELGGSEPKAVIIFNSIARSKLLGERKEEGIKAIQEAVGFDTPLIGFYTYGEQALPNGKVCDSDKCNGAFHNETVVVFVIGE
ncbi:MAG: FIST N-terminal domain-containing protein [Candidatus Pacebacteria bacterium]|nr:FIST N-terminal domain-containing protein [Candidatus Paceibacterota bacterium]